MDIDKIISQAHMKNADWTLENYQEGTSVFHQIYCYVFDVDKGKLELMSLNEEMFYEVVKRPKYLCEEVSHMLLKRIEQYFSERRTKKLMGSLAMYLTNYIAGTQSWQRAKHQIHNGSDIKPHIFITVYRGKRNIHKRLVRPFIILSQHRVLSSTEAVEYFGQVIRIDAQNHPDWIR